MCSGRAEAGRMEPSDVFSNGAMRGTRRIEPINSGRVIRNILSGHDGEIQDR